MISFQCMRFVLILFPAKVSSQMQFPDVCEFTYMSFLAFGTCLSR